MPVRNAQPYLRACIDSIIAQTYKDWELIAVDDHSTDDSLKILKEYVAQDDRIIVLNNKKGYKRREGIIDALRFAYSKSRGSYITRMDADDLMTSDKLDLMVSKQIERPHSLTIGKVKYFSDETEVGEGYLNYAEWLNELTESGENYSEIYKECSIPSPNWMTSKASLDRVKAFLPDTYPEDYDLAFRFRRARLRLNNVNEVTHHWRDHKSRTSRNSKVYLDNNFLPVKIKYFLEEEPMRDVLILWGAGRKGKAVARQLIENKVRFQWLSNNSKKIGHMIYGQLIKSSDLVGSFKFSPVIIAVSQRGTKEQIEQSLTAKKKELVYWFC